MARRIAKLTVGGVTKVVDLLRTYVPPAGSGYGTGGYGTQGYGS